MGKPPIIDKPVMNEVPSNISNVVPISMPMPDTTSTFQNVELIPTNGDSVSNWPIEVIAETDSVPQPAPVSKKQTALPVFTNIPSLDDDEPLWLNVRIPYTGDLMDDKHRLKTIFEFLTQFGGKDYFRFYIPIGKKETVIEFPNHRIRYSDRLRKQLVKILSPDAIWMDGAEVGA